MTKGSDMVAAERQRQIDEEGYTLENDYGTQSELTAAGVNYANHALTQIECGSRMTNADPIINRWPWREEFWKPVDEPIGNLVKAAALIIAAIDAELARKDRFATTDPQLDEAERLVSDELRRLSLNPGWDEDGTSIGAQALVILQVLAAAGWRPKENSLVQKSMSTLHYAIYPDGTSSACICSLQKDHKISLNVEQNMMDLIDGE